MAEEHKITVERSTDRVRAVRDGQVLADSSRPLVLHEAGYGPRYYLPPQDVHTELLTASETHTYCPYKGTATYWSLPGAPDLVWAYPDPKPEVADIKDHFCFYEVEVEEAG